MLLDTFSVDLLSNTEFLVYKLPKTGRGMTRDEATLFIDLIEAAISGLECRPKFSLPQEPCPKPGGIRQKPMIINAE